MHAPLLLMADQDHPAGRYKDVEIAKALGVRVKTVARTCRKYSRQGEKAAVGRGVRATPPPTPSSTVPLGRDSWRSAAHRHPRGGGA